eukprot:NODE_22438_length_708_cov_3.795181.p4 GENE.NODE_22438_length_708_cov_3.795181~~NODE_22438_length_708_cov_3.795181.p4  ORF type:complete len:90 (+),score=24.02 NODE_22438_length_708_cov_3.795181:40-270(+)
MTRLYQALGCPVTGVDAKLERHLPSPLSGNMPRVAREARLSLVKEQAAFVNELIILKRAEREEVFDAFDVGAAKNR